MSLLPCFYFPTTIAFVDDNRSMLDNLSLSLDPNLPFRLYENPEKALSEIQAQLTINKEFIQNNFLNDEDDDDIIRVNYSAIRNLSLNSKRFSSISTLVVDYGMPKMTGLELCKQISDLPLKKIMLTGEAGPTLAVNAFNNKLIDQFIIKAAPDMQSHLLLSIKNAQWGFFLEQSKDILAVLNAQFGCALFEPAYQELIQNIFDELYPCEFYLLDQAGSFLFINERGEMSWIVVKTKKEIINYYEIALDYSRSQPISYDVLSDLKYCKKIPFLFSEYHQSLKVSYWGRYMHPANLLVGNTDYYYTIIQGKPDYFPVTPILSYSSYLKSLAN